MLAGAERTAEAPALIAPDGSVLSYAKLLARVDAASVDLCSCGVRPDDRVALVLPNAVATAVAFLASASAAVACPLNTGYRRAEFDFLFEDLQTRTLITDPALDDPASAVARSRGMRILDIAELGIGPTAALRHESAKSDLALILHTSGTTAKPKMVALTHANLHASATNIAAWLELSPGDRCHNVMPLFHIHGLVAAILTSLISQRERRLQQRIRRAPIPHAIANSPADMVHRSADDASIHPGPSGGGTAALPLRFVRSASAPLRPETACGLANLFRAPVVEAYGITEAAHQICSNPLGPGRQRYGSVGVAAGSEVAILDELGDPVACGALGEVAIRGANVSVGYVAEPAASAHAFARGWFRTGDLGPLRRRRLSFSRRPHQGTHQSGRGEDCAARD